MFKQKKRPLRTNARALIDLYLTTYYSIALARMELHELKQQKNMLLTFFITTININSMSQTIVNKKQKK